MFLAEGERVVAEALASGAPVEEVFFVPGAVTGSVVEDAGAAGSRMTSVSPEVMARLCSTVTPRGPVATVGFVDRPLAELPGGAGRRCVAVLAGIADPGNLGTILRSADAAGASGAVLTRSSVDVYNGKAIRASAGSLFHVPVVRAVGLEEAVSALRARGFRVLAAAARSGRSIYREDLEGPVAFVFGNESRGLDGSAAGLTDAAVEVPMPGRAESLNLASAASVMLFEWARRG